MYPLLKIPKTAHLYNEGSTFKKVMMLYRFDNKLRLLMFNEIEKIEIAIRRAVMQIEEIRGRCEAERRVCRGSAGVYEW